MAESKITVELQRKGIFIVNRLATLSSDAGKEYADVSLDYIAPSVDSCLAIVRHFLLVLESEQDAKAAEWQDYVREQKQKAKVAHVA